MAGSSHLLDKNLDQQTKQLLMKKRGYSSGKRKAQFLNGKKHNRRALFRQNKGQIFVEILMFLILALSTLVSLSLAEKVAKEEINKERLNKKKRKGF